MLEVYNLDDGNSIKNSHLATTAAAATIIVKLHSLIYVQR